MKVDYQVHFGTGRKGRKQIKTGTRPDRKPIESGRVPRISKLMAIAIKSDQLIRDGQVSSYAHLARLGHITRGRATQIMNLLHLAPTIAEEILHLPHVTSGRDRIHERALRPVVAQLSWRKQQRLWEHLKDTHLMSEQELDDA